MKKLLNVALAIVLLLLLTGCREADKVSYNVSKEADSFNVTRKITVINVRDDNILYELTGNFALMNDDTNELTVISEVGKGVYKKDFIYLSEWTTYIVQDVSGAYSDPYHYEVNILPLLKGVSGNVQFEFGDKNETPPVPDDGAPTGKDVGGVSHGTDNH